MNDDLKYFLKCAKEVNRVCFKYDISCLVWLPYFNHYYDDKPVTHYYYVNEINELLENNKPIELFGSSLDIFGGKDTQTQIIFEIDIVAQIIPDPEFVKTFEPRLIEKIFLLE
jgi:hypothetical protein